MMSLIIDHIPHEPGVYLFQNKSGKILYIGKAKDLRKRVQQYFTPGSVRKQEMVAKAATIDFITVTNESESLFLEDNLIKQHQPPFNSLLKGDNTYIFVKITQEEFPQILFTRKRKTDGALYIGPKRSSKKLKNVLRHIRRYLQYRGCKQRQFNQGKLCSDYFRGLCKGRCVFAQLKNNTPGSQELFSEAKKLGLSIDQTYDSYRQDYTDLMSLLAATIDGNPKQLITRIHDDIQHCIQTHNFERAAQLKDVYQELHQYYEKQSVVLDEHINGDVVKLVMIGQYYVFVMISIRGGRMVDVIRHKISTDDTSLHELLTLREMEWGGSLMIKYYDSGRKNLDINYHELSGIDQLDDLLPQSVIIYDASMSHVHRAMGDVEIMMQTALDSYIVSSAFDQDNIMDELLQGMQHRFLLKSYPYRIECVDISHFGGKQTSGGLSCLQGGLPHKYGYRRYKIRTTDTGDDYQALREVMIRRFKLDSQLNTKDKKAKTKENNTEQSLAEHISDLPNLFVLDGGRAQLGLVPALAEEYPQLREIMQQTQFAALEKGKARKRSNKSVSGSSPSGSEHLHILLDDGSIITKPFVYDKIDQLLVKLRDEAHRFANAYRKKQASKEWK